jgi:hypothetical protein
VEHLRTGLLCHTLADYCLGVRLALDNRFDRAYVRERALRYDMYNVALEYDYAFRCIADLHGKGWYAEESHLSATSLPLISKSSGNCSSSAAI